MSPPLPEPVPNRRSLCRGGDNDHAHPVLPQPPEGQKSAPNKPGQGHRSLTKRKERNDGIPAWFGGEGTLKLISFTLPWAGTLPPSQGAQNSINLALSPSKDGQEQGSKIGLKFKRHICSSSDFYVCVWIYIYVYK